MPSNYYRTRFLELSSYCLPRGVAIHLRDPIFQKKVLAYEKVCWADLSNEQKDYFLGLILERKDVNTGENQPWIERQVFVLRICVDYLLLKNNGQMLWFELEGFLNLDKILHCWHEECDPNAKVLLNTLLDTVPGWPNSLLSAYSQFGFICAGIRATLSLVSRSSMKRVGDLVLYLGGARRLGGEIRLLREIEEMLREVWSFPGLAGPVLEVVLKNFDQKLIWKALPAWAKGRVLENDLGM